MIYGYANSKSEIENNSENQLLKLLDNGCIEVIEEQYIKKERPRLEELIKKLESGDTLVVTKIDVLVEDLTEGLELVELLLSRGITLKVLNMVTFDNEPEGKMLLNIFNMFIAFNEFEKEIHSNKSNVVVSKKKENKVGKFTKNKIDNALSLLKSNGGESTYNEVAKLTGISKSTLLRAMNKLRER